MGLVKAVLTAPRGPDVRKFSRGCFLMVAVALVYICGVGPVAWSQQAEETETLEVIGRGTISGGNVAKARDEAIADGLRNAVEQGVGLLIPSVSVVDNFQLLSDQVYSKADEVIHHYKVLAESQAGEHYRLVIQATLLAKVLQGKLQDLGVLTMDKGLPSVLFLLSEQNIGQISPRYSWQQGPFSDFALTIERTLSRYMHEKGFFVVDNTTVTTLGSDLGPEDVSSELTDGAAIELARKLNAEVVIVGQGSAHFSGNVSGSGVKTVEADLSVRAIRIDQGMVIGSSEKTRASVHANEMTAGTEALALAASDVAEDLSKQLVANWGKASGQPVLVELVVGGIREYGDFVKFRTVLRDDIRSVKNVYLRAIKAGEAMMDVDIRGNTRMLADELMLKSFEGFGVSISEVDENRIRLELIRKQDVLDGPQRLEDEGDLHRYNDVKTYPAY
jgi:hypothetical protein